MGKVGYADAEELIRWGARFDAKAGFPRLVRGLILETGRGVVQLGFRAGAGVHLGGWDGTVHSTAPTAHVPLGLSLWELSTARDAREKADKDYARQRDVPDGSDPGTCTYVAVTLQRWPGKNAWAEARRAEGRWQDVRAYDVDDLDTWLQVAPITHAWVSEQLGLSPHGIRAAEAWWEDWSKATDPAISPSVVLAGRDDPARELLSRLVGNPQVISLRAPSLEESLAFISAVAIRAADSDGGRLLARIAFVDGIEAWRALLSHGNPLILVARTQEVAQEIPARSPHHLIVPLMGPGVADITLPPLDSAEVSKALREAGLAETEAQRAGSLSRLSLLALRRRLALKPELHQPGWATPPVQRWVRGLLLAGRWNDSKAGDRRVVGNLVGADYGVLREGLSALTALEDPFLAAIGSSWGLVSPYDAWLLLGAHIQPGDLHAFQGAVGAVLGSVNPAFELPEEERWLAPIHGKVPEYSEDLRQGLATSLALLGVHGGAVSGGAGLSGVDWANLLVQDILEKANNDRSGMLWASLGDVLPLLAEAAPDRFLDAVQEGLKGDPPVLLSMFADSKAQTPLSHSPHTGLLWALESVGWSADHFGQAVDLLAKLAEIDPGGRLSNRPFASLRAVFCPWLPQNSVTPERRLAAVDGLRERRPDVAWRLMVELLPERHAVLLPTYEPRYRAWKPATIAVTRHEYWRFVEELLGRLLADVGTQPGRWTALLETMDDLPPASRAQVRKQLVSVLEEGTLTPATKSELWEAVRTLVAKHRAFADAAWALPPEEVDALDELAQRLSPTDPSVKHAWLFDEHLPVLPNLPRDGDWDAYQKVVDEFRRDAVTEVDTTFGWLGLHEFARSSKLSWAVGMAMADAGMAQHEENVLGLLDSEVAADTDLASGYLTRRFRLEGWPWAEPLLAKPLTELQKGRILVCTGDFPRAWELAEAMGDGVGAAFWKYFPASGLGHDFAHAAYAAGRLMEVGRRAAALGLLRLYAGKGEQSERHAELILTGLEQLASTDRPDPESALLGHHDLVELFAYLQSTEDIDWQRLARLEWAHAGVLVFEGRLQTLHRLMAQDPDFFVDVISKIYRAKGEEAGDLTAERKALAESAYRVLSSWRTVPGVQPDGSIDADGLRTWVARAREQLRDVDRLEIGDLHIGHILASSLPDGDGSWPPHPVREVLEEVQSNDVEEGLEVQVSNLRGATVRLPTEGGKQERDLAAHYKRQAEKLADQWPRSAAILRRIAGVYEQEARLYDEQAERFRAGFDG